MSAKIMQCAPRVALCALLSLLAACSCCSDESRISFRCPPNAEAMSVNCKWVKRQFFSSFMKENQQQQAKQSDGGERATTQPNEKLLRTESTKLEVEKLKKRKQAARCGGVSKGEKLVIVLVLDGRSTFGVFFCIFGFIHETFERTNRGMGLNFRTEPAPSGAKDFFRDEDEDRSRASSQLK